MKSRFSDMTSSSNFFDSVLFLLSSLVTGPGFMSNSWLVLELWQLSFIKDWPEIRKSEIPPSEFRPISRDWVKLVTPNLARMFLIKCYWMLQNVRITAIIVYELLRENQQGDKITPPTQITKLGQLIDISKNNNFYESFEQFGGLWLRYSSFSI